MATRSVLPYASGCYSESQLGHKFAFPIDSSWLD